MTRILILGGGFGGVYTLKYLHKFFHGNRNIKLILVNKKNYFLFTPLLHEVATGSISLENIIEPIRKIIKCCDYDFVQGEVKKIDLENKKVYINNFEIDYDFLVLALGSKPNFYNIPGAEENSFTLKSLDDAIKLRNHFVYNLELASKKPTEELLNFVIVGGGATGIELAGEMSEYFYSTFSKFYPRELINKIQIFLIEKSQELIPQFSSKLRKIAFDVLIKKKIKVLLNKGVVEVGKNFVKFDDKTEIKTNTVIWTAGVKPNLPEIISNINIEKDKSGRLILNEYLQVKNCDNVFALGDNCCFIQNEKPLPQLAQVAVRQAKICAENIFNLINNKSLKNFRYKHQGDLISLGRFFAMGEIKGFSFSGKLAWVLWRGVYLSKMISLPHQIRTFVDCILDLFYPRNISEL